MKEIRCKDIVDLFQGNSPYSGSTPWDPVTTTRFISITSSAFANDWATSGTARNWHYVQLSHVRRAHVAAEAAAHLFHRRNSNRIRVVDSSIGVTVAPKVAEASEEATMRLHYMVLQMLTNPEGNNPLTASTEFGMQRAMLQPARYPYDKSQPRVITLSASQSISWKVLETGYKTFKAFPTDVNGNERNPVSTFYINLNKYMRGVEVEYAQATVSGTMANIRRNGFILCFYAENRSHSAQTAVQDLGSAHADKIGTTDNKWQIAVNHKLRFMDMEDNAH